MDAVKRPLTRPYDGPYRVIRAGTKVFTVLRHGKEWNVSVDRLKVAPDPLDLDLDSFTSQTTVARAPEAAVESAGPVPDVALRRSSRASRPPLRIGGP